MSRTRFAFPLVLLFFASLNAGQNRHSAAAANPALPSPVLNAAMAHLNEWGPGALRQANAAGVDYSWIRCDLPWAKIEPTKGAYSWTWADGLFDELEETGKKLLGIVAFGTPAWTGTWEGFPDTPEKRAAYVNYLKATVDRYAARNPGILKAIELWNEGNGSWSGGYNNKDFIPLYFQLAKDVYTALRADHKYDSLIIAAAATVLIPVPFIEDLFDLGLLDYCDAVSVHPYYGVDDMLYYTGQLNDLMVSKGKTRPIWFTEWSGGGANDTPESRYKDVQWIVAMQSVPDLAFASYYLLREHAGWSWLMDKNGNLTQNGKAWNYAFSRVKDAGAKGRVPSSFPTSIYKFTKDNATIHVCWASMPVKITVSGQYTANNELGEPVAAAGSHDLTAQPLFITGDVTVAEDLGAYGELAHSFGDFSNEQGKNGWTYLSETGGQTGELKWDRPWYWFYCWWDSRDTWARITAGGASTGNNISMIRRFTIPEGISTIRVRADFNSASGGDGADGCLVELSRASGGQTTTYLQRRNLLNAKASLDTTFDVEKDDHIDIKVGPESNSSYDNVGYMVQILAKGYAAIDRRRGERLASELSGSPAGALHGLAAGGRISLSCKTRRPGVYHLSICDMRGRRAYGPSAAVAQYANQELRWDFEAGTIGSGVYTAVVAAPSGTVVTQFTVQR